MESGDGPYAQLVTIGRHIICADEGEAAGGSDFGPSPYEYVMAGLGACTAMTLRMYAARHNWPLEKVSVVVRHKKVATADGKAIAGVVVIAACEQRRTRRPANRRGVEAVVAQTLRGELVEIWRRD